MPNLNDALKQLSGFVRNLDFDAPPPSSLISSEPFVMLSKGETTVFVRGEDSDRFRESVRAIFDAVSSKEIIGLDSVDRLASNLVVSAAQVKRENPTEFETHIREQLLALRDVLQSDPTLWEFFIPVVGFAPSELPFEVGRIEFYQADSSGAQEYCRRLSELNPTYEGRRAEEFLSVDLRAQFGDKSIARVHVSAIDLSAAHRRALRAVRRTLDCINLFADKDSGTALYVKGDIEQGQRVDAAIQLLQPARPTGRSTRIAPWRALPIKQISTRRGFGRISELLNKETPSDLEERILKAIQWAGRARIEPRVEESFLLFAVALETLLIRDSGSPADLLYKLKLRAAHLLSRPDLISRKLVGKQIGELYKTRSKIVHAGKFDVTDTELSLMDEYTRIALFIVLDSEPFRSMTAEEEFEAWFEARLLAPPLTTDEPAQNLTATAPSID